MDTAQEWDGVLHALYETALAPETLPQALARCAAWVGADTYHVLSFDAQDGSALLSVASPESSEAERRYLDHYALIDPRRDSLAGKAVGQVAACQLEFSPAFVSRSEIWQDLLIPSNARYTAGGVLRRDGQAHTVVGFHRPAAPGAFRDEELHRTARLLPHLARAARLLGRARDLQDAARDSRHGADLHPDGSFVLSREGRLLWANAAGEALLADGAALRLAGGQLAPGPQSRVPLRELLARVQASGRPESLRLTPATSRLSAFEALYIHVLRLAPHERHGRQALARDRQDGQEGPDVAHWTGRAAAGDAALLVIAHRPSSGNITPRALAQLFGLTPAEAALAAGLAQGMTLDDYAQRNGVRDATVRTHARAIYAKTGVRRLQDLLRLLGGMRAPR